MAANRYDWETLDPKLRALVDEQAPRGEIARQLGLSIETVKFRMKKLGLITQGNRGRGSGRAASAPSAFDPPKGRMPALNYLPPDELEVDHTYQRSIEGKDSQRLIVRIAKGWDWSKCLPLLVSAREGGAMFVIDGQHRLTAARMRGDIGQLPCVVVSVGGREGEAALFDAVNSQRRALSPLELFRAALASGDAETLAILAAIEAAGLSLAPHENFHSWKPGMVANVGGIRQSWRQHGAKATSEALRVLAEAFPGQVLRFAGTIFAGLALLVAEGRGGDLALVLGSKSQEAWRGLIMAARAEDARLNWKKAGHAVIGEALCAMRLRAAVDPSKFIGGKAWCEQCEMQVALVKAQGCKSRFCSLKRVPAQVVAA